MQEAWLFAPDSSANDCTLYHTLWGVVPGVTSKVSTGLIVSAVVVGRSSKQEHHENRSIGGNPGNPSTTTASE